MTIKDTITDIKSKWVEGSGPDSDVVISSRIRLARNLELLPFPHVLSEQGASDMLQKVQQSITHEDMNKKIGLMEFVRLDELTPLERQILVEKHLVSPQFTQNTQNKAVIIKDNETISIMVNEEDHLRIQCIYSGLQIENAWQISNELDNVLEETLDFAYCEKKGYLTTCPTNVGTGLRASVMLHLPVSVLTNQIGQILSAIGKLGFVVRGFYGEGTEANGNLFQISNQVTLGPSEEEIISSLVGITKQIIAQERSTRVTLLKENKFLVEDKIFRSFAVLRNARIITSEETMQLLSDVSLGLDLGIINDVAKKTINELMIMTRPAFLQQLVGHELNPLARDIKRAELIREKLN